MSRKINIKKVLAAIAYCLAGVGLLVLLGAAMKARKTKKCSGIEVTINGDYNSEGFISKKDVLAGISGTHQSLIGKNMNRINLMEMEKTLEKNIWIRDADLFFDNRGILRISVKERQPIARIFSSSGSSFYIDSSCGKLPLSRKVAVKLPVFTGYPFGMSKPSAADSLLLSDIRLFSRFMMRNPFWMSQITQVNITPAREFEMVPLIGNHIIEFGPAEGMEKKFKRLMIFYTQVLSKIGMDHYARLKLQFDNEVIGVRNEKTAPISSNNPTPPDPVPAEADIEAPVEDAVPAPVTEASKPVSTAEENEIEKKKTVSVKPVPRPVLKTKDPLPSKTKKKVPKAVMPKRN